MKLKLIVLLAILPCLLAAQADFLLPYLGAVKMGTPIKEFKATHKKFVEDKTSDFRTDLQEDFTDHNIEYISYYFDREGQQPLYEIIIKLRSVAAKDATIATLFGPTNHPSMDNHWVICNTSDDYLTVGWHFDQSFVLCANLPSTEYYDNEMFKNLGDFPKTDLRIGKRTKNTNKTDNSDNSDGGVQMPGNSYAVEMTKIFSSGVEINMPADSLKFFFPKVKKKSVAVKTRTEQTLKVNSNGLNTVDFVCMPESPNRLYQIVLEFENADTLKAMIEHIYGPANHPSLEDHWVLGQDKAKGVVFLCWIFNNKALFAMNLVGSELEGDVEFMLPDDFILPGNENTNGGDVNNTDNGDMPSSDEDIKTHQFNQFIGEAMTDFTSLQGDPVLGKTGVFYSSVDYLGANQTTLRKNAAGKLRLEAQFASGDIDVAKANYDQQLSFILNMEGLEYRLVKKSEFSTNTGKTYIWNVQTADDQPLDILVKLQLYPSGSQQYGVRLEIGK